MIYSMLSKGGTKCEFKRSLVSIGIIKFFWLRLFQVTLSNKYVSPPEPLSGLSPPSKRNGHCVGRLVFYLEILIQISVGTYVSKD